MLVPAEGDPTKPAYETFPYSAIALTKCVMYKINRPDFNKLPPRAREQMI